MSDELDQRINRAAVRQAVARTVAAQRDTPAPCTACDNTGLCHCQRRRPDVIVIACASCQGTYTCQVCTPNP